jgi:MerR family transcriptional regulator, copper efflux regulator
MRRMETTAMETISIGALARRAGVSIDTVRYYEKSGLLVPQARLASGYRRYAEPQVVRLRFIRRAQELGFSLRDISDLLGLSRQRDVGRIKRSAERKLAEVDKRIAALQRVRGGLSELIAKCPGHGRAADCPILKALGEESVQ